MSLSRRNFLASTAFASGTMLTALAAPTLARAPLAAAPTVGALRRKIGSIEVTALLDGYLDVQPDIFIGIDQVEAEKLAKAAFRKPGPQRLPVNAFLVNLGDHLVLIDAGTAQTMGPTLGRLPAALKEAGVTPEQVDTLLITHMHPDHINGALTADGQALFPNAELVVTATDYAFWHDDGIMNQAPEEHKGFFLGARKAAAAYADRLRRIGSEENPVGSIRSLALPGHTPGHTGFLVESDGEALLIWGDIAHLATFQFAYPEWSIAFDVDPALAADTRKKILDQTASDRMMVAGGHLPFPGFGHVARDGDAYRLVPAEWPYAL